MTEYTGDPVATASQHEQELAALELTDHPTVQAAYRSDTRAIVAEARLRNGAAISPLLALRRLGYRRAMIDERGSTTLATGL